MDSNINNTKSKYDPSLWPKERKPKPKNGKLDELGFYYTPNGSFYDYDNEYFNRNGFDIHGGFYTDNKEYIYGPSWLDEFACYEDEVENSNNHKLNESDDNYLEPNNDYEEEGDFADDDNNFNDDIYEKYLKEAEDHKNNLNKDVYNFNINKDCKKGNTAIKTTNNIVSNNNNNNNIMSQNESDIIDDIINSSNVKTNTKINNKNKKKKQK